MILFPGIPEVSWAHRFERAFISIARLRRRKSGFAPPVREWAMDSAAFSEVALTGGYAQPPQAFAREAADWVARVPGCAFVATQDFMCEPFVLAKTGLTLAEHQRLTIERYDAIADAWEASPSSATTPILPVLQGFSVDDYRRCVELYGDRLRPNAWVGVGSVCKRQGDVRMIRNLLAAILDLRPDLRLHGFGVKLTALENSEIRRLLYSADSMAWSFSARKQGRDPNDWREAQRFTARVESWRPAALPLFDR